MACVLLYLGIGKKFEPLLLVGIAFGVLLTNIPGAALYHMGMWDAYRRGHLRDPADPLHRSPDRLPDVRNLLKETGVTERLSDTAQNALMNIATLFLGISVSAVPMAARVSQDVGREADPNNFLLMHAMDPNAAGVIGSAIAAGFLIAVFA